MRSLFDFLGRRKRPSILALAFALVAAIGALDYFTGWEISLWMFYLAPVALAAWYAGTGAAVFISAVSAIVWLEVNGLAGILFSRPLIGYWNAFLRFAFFASVGAILVVLRRTLEELQGALEREQMLARRDGLTGAWNARAFYEMAGQEVRVAQRTMLPTTVAYLDVDGFKGINDDFGHTTGDRVLRAIAQTLAGILRETDIVARVGGDEFALLLPNTSHEAGRAVLTKVRAGIGASMEREGWPITVSLGAVTAEAGSLEDIHTLIDRADQLMYVAKRRGKNEMELELRQAAPAEESASSDGAGGVQGNTGGTANPASARRSGPKRVEYLG